MPHARSFVGNQIVHIVCKLRGHRPDRHRAWHDTADWRSNCTLCAVPLIKDAMTQKWRAFDTKSDFLLTRTGKPSRDKAAR